MKCCCAALLVVFVAVTPLRAADPPATPIRDSLTRAAAQATVSHVVRAPDDAGAYLLSGTALLATGITLEILSWTSLRHEAYACAYTYYTSGCAYESSTNTPVLITGLALGTVGGVLLQMGLHKRSRARPSVQVTPHGVRVSQRLTF